MFLLVVVAFRGHARARALPHGQALPVLVADDVWGGSARKKTPHSDKESKLRLVPHVGWEVV